MTLATLELPTATVVLRPAEPADLPVIVGLLAADQLDATRESTADPEPYGRALEAIDADPAHLLVVGVAGDEVVATFQLSFIPGLARAGALRAQIEAVRVREDLRSAGIGAAMMRWAIEESRERGAALVQLTSDAERLDAQRFYERLGFEPTHVGFKLRLAAP